jgi:hypothetical protein
MTKMRLAPRLPAAHDHHLSCADVLLAARAPPPPSPTHSLTHSLCVRVCVRALVCVCVADRLEKSIAVRQGMTISFVLESKDDNSKRRQKEMSK